MSYIQKHLMSDERIVLRARLHAIVYLPAFLVLLIAAASFFLLHGWGAGSAATVVIPGLLGLIALILFLPAFVRRTSSEFAVTNKRVVVKLGALHRRSMEILLRQVEGITVEQGLAGRLFDFGTIIIEGTGSDRTAYAGISEPMRFRLAVQEQIDQSFGSANSNPGPGISGEADRYSALLKLNELKEKGALTAEEFESEKRKWLRQGETTG